MPFEPDYMIDIDDGALVSTEEELRRAFAKAGDKPLVLHVHGGLVGRDSAIAAAIHARPHYDAAGAYALFPIWRTGIWETLGDTWTKIAGETLFRLIVDRVAGWTHALVKEIIDGTRGVPQRTLPEVTVDVMRASGEGKGDFDAAFMQGVRPEQVSDELEMTDGEERAIRAALDRDLELQLEIDAVLEGSFPAADPASRGAGIVNPQAPKPSVADRDALRELADDRDTRSLSLAASLKIAKIIKEVLKRYRKKTHHGFHATVTEEVLRAFYLASIGRTVWTDMKEDARKSFDGAGAAGSLLLREINAVAGTRQVTLVGHSAGAIFISEMVKAAGNGLREVDVVFLAPAVRCSLFRDGVIDNAARIRNFRMFSMNDTHESCDTLIRDTPLGDLTWFYPRSLLYFISGILEKDVDADVLGLQRFHDAGVWNADDGGVKAARTFCAPAGRASWATNDGADLRMRTNSTRHGGFGRPGDGNTTMETVAYLVKHGWQ